MTSSRLAMRREYEKVQDRINEIDTLTARFHLLAEHYSSDEARLASIIEAGQFFTLEDSVSCIVCGAAPEHHRPEQACDGNVLEITAAATAEVLELQDRAVELQMTIAGLKSERDELAAMAREILPRLEILQADILREVPTVQTIRLRTNQVIARKLSIQRSLELVRRRETLMTQRGELGVSPGYDSSTIVAQQQLDGATLDAFSQVVEAELQSWGFPEARRVFFELPKMDISVAGKSRAANGKGVRALLHGAFDIGFMKFCRSRGRSHPGFLILDSLFITYKDPSDDADNVIATTPLKDRAFDALSKISSDLQIIILENVDVPEWLIGKPQVIHFTGSDTIGRVGLFPK